MENIQLPYYYTIKEAAEFYILYSDLEEFVPSETTEAVYLQTRIPILFPDFDRASDFLQAIRTVSDQYAKASIQYSRGVPTSEIRYSVPVRDLFSRDDNAYRFDDYCSWAEYPKDFKIERRLFSLEKSPTPIYRQNIEFYDTGNIKVTSLEVLLNNPCWQLYEYKNRDQLIALWSITPDPSGIPLEQRVWVYREEKLRLFTAHQLEAAILAYKRSGRIGGRAEDILFVAAADYLNNSPNEISAYFGFIEEQEISVDKLANHYLEVESQ